jgi:hypothetical protein
MNSRRLIADPQLGIVAAQTCTGEGPVNVRFGSKADICSAAAHVRFTPNSDIDCVFRHVCFGPIADILQRDGHVRYSFESGHFASYKVS